MLGKLEKLNTALLTAGLIVLACFIIYSGVSNLFSGDYTSLGDPYYTNQILAFERAPVIIWITLINLAFVVVQLIFTLLKKPWHKS